MGSCNSSSSNNVTAVDAPAGDVDEIRTCLMETSFKDYLSSTQLEDLALSFTKKVYSGGETLAKKGERLQGFYIIQKGQVQMHVDGEEVNDGTHSQTLNSKAQSYIKDTEVSNTRKSSTYLKRLRTGAVSQVFTKGAGEFLGAGFFKLGKAGKQKQWLATIKTDTNACAVWYMTSKAYEAFLDKHPRAHQAMQDSVGLSMEPELRTLDVFSEMDDVKIEILASLFRYFTKSAGQTIFSEGDNAKTGLSLYFILQGNVTVQARIDGKRATMTDLGAGSFFGEVGLLIGIPRTATVRAKTMCLMLELRNGDFRKFAQVCPEIFQRFKDGIDNYQINLTHWLANSHIMAYFIEFCKREFTIEALEFWRACQSYNDLVNLQTLEIGEAELVKQALRTEHKDALWACLNDMMRFSDEEKAILTEELNMKLHEMNDDAVDKRLDVMGSYKQKDATKSPRYSLTPEDKKELSILAKIMIDHYIKPGALKQVNISNKFSQAIIERVADGDVDEKLFAEAEIDVVGLMNRNSWKRFQKDENFLECLEMWYDPDHVPKNERANMRSMAPSPPNDDE